ncbi:MAG: NAD(+)/NADH kinase, partial [Lachnospiraceae bacterium]|nr:NAD(+)/NADH kinase [Lachnospiraceae bacterium]
MDRFAIITNPIKDRRGEAAAYILQYLNAHGKEGVILKDEPFTSGTDSHTNPELIPDGTECIIAIGGDGTIIRAARDLIDLQIPLIGVNMGTLGYLAEIDMNSLDEGLDQLMETTPMIEQRMMLQGDIIRDGQVIYSDVAMNDIVVGRANSLNVIYFSVEVDGELLKKYAADGMIVATPTGSTAYNLSAGGPIVAPAASMILMTPISPHTMINRSIVLPETAKITIELTPRKDRESNAIVGFDGKGE